MSELWNSIVKLWQESGLARLCNFENGGWIIARFSGTEPLIRVFCEMPTEELAKQTSDEMCAFLGL